MQVNIVPVIAKADTLTGEECQKFKQRVTFFTSIAIKGNLHNLLSYFFSFHINANFIFNLFDNLVDLRYILNYYVSWHDLSSAVVETFLLSLSFCFL